LCVVALLALVLVGCSAPAASVQTQTARGVLLDVVSTSLQKIDSFTLRTDDGRELMFVPASNFNADAAHAMTPGHMRQHMAIADPVLVTYQEQDGKLVALSAVDASAQ
jgi:hypothetical protein